MLPNCNYLVLNPMPRPMPMPTPTRNKLDGNCTWFHFLFY